MAVADEDRPRFMEQDRTMFLRHAGRVSVSEADSPRRYRRRFALWGAGARVRESRCARQEVNDSALPHLVNVIENESGMDGLAEQAAGGFSWRARDSGGLLTVTVARGSGVTEVVATADRAREARLAIAASFAGTSMAAYLGGAALASVLPAGVVIAMVIAAFPLALVGAARWLRGRMARRWREVCARVVDALVARMERSSEGQ